MRMNWASRPKQHSTVRISPTVGIKCQENNWLWLHLLHPMFPLTVIIWRTGTRRNESLPLLVHNDIVTQIIAHCSLGCVILGFHSSFPSLWSSHLVIWSWCVCGKNNAGFGWITCRAHSPHRYGCEVGEEDKAAEVGAKVFISRSWSRMLSLPLSSTNACVCCCGAALFSAIFDLMITKSWMKKWEIFGKTVKHVHWGFIFIFL